MAVRVLIELLLGLAVIAAILIASYRYASVRQGTSPNPRPELDVSMAPSTWFTDSRTTEDGFTEVCIVRVENRTGVVRERRILRRLDNAAGDYGTALDTAMDEAYAAMRVANVNLNRR
ncbi:MAG TPA: hypothetical protein VGN18_07890 [Jatrophihabitans sp.]|jgi:hypothetical protein|uniref:hypothetical protein n=1 Tax=Jatrophihabitans sp. TaxID=1932789 RepID=UPI002E04E07E|nr:hypothetical protein [Jatrophihabitans sp.]